MVAISSDALELREAYSGLPTPPSMRKILRNRRQYRKTTNEPALLLHLPRRWKANNQALLVGNSVSLAHDRRRRLG